MGVQASDCLLVGNVECKKPFPFQKTKVGFVNLTTKAEAVVEAFKSLKMHEQQQMESTKVEK